MNDSRSQTDSMIIPRHNVPPRRKGVSSLGRFGRPFVLSVIVAFGIVCEAWSLPLEIVRNGRSTCRIVLCPDASALDRTAAERLQGYLQRISDVRIPIVQGDTATPGKMIWIGSAGRADGFPGEIQWGSLAEDGFTIRCEGEHLLIAGGSGKGTLYGVYTFLEKYLGCRKYSSEVEVLPRRRTIALGAIDDTQAPHFTFRDAYTYDPSYMEWHKLDNHDELFGMYVHTFRRLVPPDVHFAKHPEFYTMTPAGRVSDAQLCLTNRTLLSVVTDSLRAQMQRQPDRRYWSVSQNDTFGPCECDQCKAVDNAEGSPSGTIIRFVNSVAAQFPDKIISTLAYQYSRSVPKLTWPAVNVNIMLCSIECNRSRPLASDPSSASFRTDLEAWTSRTQNIYLWDYVVNFRNLMSPFPNLRVLQPNLQYFASRGITAVFEQGSGRQPNEFKELRTYLIAKLLWDPDCDINAVMNDFLEGYYGKAAPFIRKYIDTMHDAMESSGEDLGIYGFPLPSATGYLSPREMDTYVSLFDRAEKAVHGDRTMETRVRIARLPLQFALLEQAKMYGTGKRGCFEKGPGGTWRVKPAVTSLLKTFVARCAAYGITALDETGRSPEAYATATEEYLHASMTNNLALFRPVTLAAAASPQYHNGDASALTDGLRGLDDCRLNWLGFEGVDMEATIDLGKVRTVRRISVDFLQDINAWIFLPTGVQFSVSLDGKSFFTMVPAKNVEPATRAGFFRAPFETWATHRDARYVRVKATNMKKCPDWHKGAGGPAWIFADEIIVQ